MANVGNLWIREYEAVGWSDSVAGGGVSGPDAALPAPQEPGIDQGRIILSDQTDKQSSPFTASTRFVALCSDAPFHYEVGQNPHANINSFRLPADLRVYIGVVPGHRLSALGGSLVVTLLPAEK